MDSMLPLEKGLLKEGFELVHDGQKNADIRCFIRKYRGKHGMVLVVKHDLRSGTGDIVKLEHWEDRARDTFAPDNRPHKNGRDFFVMEAK